MSRTLLPAAVSEKELQSHSETRPFPLLTVNHTGKAAETALERPHVDALVGRPLLFRQNAGAMKAHILRGRELVYSQVHADQRNGHFQRSTTLGAARRTRIQVPPECRETRRRPSDWVATIRRLCRDRPYDSIRDSTDSRLRSSP